MPVAGTGCVAPMASQTVNHCTHIHSIGCHYYAIAAKLAKV